MTMAGKLNQSDQIRYDDNPEAIAQVQEVIGLTGNMVLLLFVEPIIDENGDSIDEWVLPSDFEVEVVGG